MANRRMSLLEKLIKAFRAVASRETRIGATVPLSGEIVCITGRIPVGLDNRVRRQFLGAQEAYNLMVLEDREATLRPHSNGI